MNHIYTNLGKDVLNDIEIFESSTESRTVIAEFECFMPNYSCKLNIEQHLKNPVYDINTLQSKQLKLKLIREILIKNYSELEKLFQIIKTYEKDVSWLRNLKSNEDDILESLDTVFYKWKYLSKCNESKILLNLKNLNSIILTPLFSLLSPLISILIPYIVLRYKFNLHIPFFFFLRIVFNIIIKAVFAKRNWNTLQFVTYLLSLFIYFQSIYSMIVNARNTYKVFKYISTKIQGIRKYLEASKSILLIFDNNKNLKLFDNILKVSNDLVLFKKIECNTDNYNDKFQTLLNETNELFAYLTIVRVINQYNLCYTEFKKKHLVNIVSENMFHLCIKDSIKNDFKLIGENCIITGPNAAGKSTLIKTLVLNILLSQSFGIACATKFILTPFYHINTQFNIPDVKGKESLFEAEMYRCKTNLDILSKTSKDNKCLFVMDEIFNSTNALEGISGAYGVLKKMSSYKNSCNIVTTHYGYLTKLSNFRKFKMEKKGDIFNYKIVKGVSKQFLAIEMLKKNFDKDVVSEALKIKNKLLV